MTRRGPCWSAALLWGMRHTAIYLSWTFFAAKQFSFELMDNIVKSEVLFHICHWRGAAGSDAACSFAMKNRHLLYGNIVMIIACC
jgi:hypothetical protein